MSNATGRPPFHASPRVIDHLRVIRREDLVSASAAAVRRSSGRRLETGMRRGREEARLRSFIDRSADMIPAPSDAMPFVAVPRLAASGDEDALFLERSFALVPVRHAVLARRILWLGSGVETSETLAAARSRLFRLGLPQTLDDDGGMRERSSWNQVLSAPVAFSPEDDFDLRLRFFASLIAWSVRKDVHDEDIRDAAAAPKSASVRFPVGDREEGRAMRAGKGRPSFQTRDARVQLGVLQHILDRRAYRRIAWTLEEGL